MDEKTTPAERLALYRTELKELRAAFAAKIKELEKHIADMETWGVPEGPRMCVNCGKAVPADRQRDSSCESTTLDGEPFSACTVDMTYGEAMEEIKRLRSALREKEI